VGKTSVGNEASEQLQAIGVAHCVVDGDNLDAAYPKAAGDPLGTALTEANLAALWSNYAALGHRRLIYVNTVSVLERAMVARAVARSATAGVAVRAVLLTATDTTVLERLSRREIGGALQVHLRRSSAMARHLADRVEEWVVPVPTDDRTVVEVAAAVVATTGWARSGGAA
jgi:hypothetical protein